VEGVDEEDRPAHLAHLAHQGAHRQARPAQLAAHQAQVDPAAAEAQAQPGKRKPAQNPYPNKIDLLSSSSSISRPSYGGGRYYGGGSATPYQSGRRSPAGIVPFALAGAALGFFPGLWLYGAYGYNYNPPYNYHNRTTDKNESLPVTCLCDKYSACGCDDPSNSTFLDSVVANGTNDQNSTLYRIGNVNGTKTLILNGTLPNGTDNSTSDTTSPSSGASRNHLLENSGFWVVGAIVGATVWLL